MGLLIVFTTVALFTFTGSTPSIFPIIHLAYLLLAMFYLFGVKLYTRKILPRDGGASAIIANRALRLKTQI